MAVVLVGGLVLVGLVALVVVVVMVGALVLPGLLDGGSLLDSRVVALELYPRVGWEVQDVLHSLAMGMGQLFCIMCVRVCQGLKELTGS